MMNKILCEIFGHDDIQGHWDLDTPFQVRVLCRRCGWRHRDGGIEYLDGKFREELKSCLLLAGLAALMGLALWRWIYVITRLDLQF